MAGTIGMVLFDVVLYIIIAWYLNNVITGEYGVSKPFNFCFKKSYWIRSSNKFNDEVSRFPVNFLKLIRKMKFIVMRM